MKEYSILTAKEQKAYDFIVRYSKKYGKYPLLIEIAKGIDIKSKGVAHRYVKSLEKAGKISRFSNKHRGISIVEKKPIFLKSLGSIAAGGPIEAISDQQRIELEYLFTNKKSYALKVKGDSMIDAGIHDGDWVIIEESKKFYKSKVHVILIDNQDVTLKYIEKENSEEIKLIPANKSYKESTYPIERISIQGYVVGQVRIY
jgi:repressor LexA